MKPHLLRVGCLHAVWFTMLGMLACAASLASGCRTAESVSQEAEIGPLPAKGFYSVWRAELAPVDNQRRGAIDRLYVTDDIIFAYSKDNQVVGIDRQSGLVRFRHDVHKSAILYPPVMLKDSFVLPTATTLEIYDKKHGDFIQTIRPGFALRGPAVGSPDSTLIYAPGSFPNGGQIVAVDTVLTRYNVGTRWNAMANTGKEFVSAPAIYAGVLYAGNLDGSVYAIHVENGAGVWRGLQDTNMGFRTGAPLRADVKADGSGVYVPSRDGKLYCLNIGDGALRWTYFANADLDRGYGPILGSDSIYLPLPTGTLASIDKNSPETPIRSHHWLANDVKQFLAQDNQYVYTLGSDNLIHAIDKIRGERVFASTRSDFKLFATNTKDGSIFAMTDDERLYCIQPISKPGAVGELVRGDAPAHALAPALASAGR